MIRTDAFDQVEQLGVGVGDVGGGAVGDVDWEQVALGGAAETLAVAKLKQEALD
jgi:hypothetical protein